MDANEGVQSFNFEVGQKFKSFKEFESQLNHYQDAKCIQMYRRSSCKIQIKFRMKVYNKIGTYKNKSTTTINEI
jgi:hypothetical protein